MNYSRNDLDYDLIGNELFTNWLDYDKKKIVWMPRSNCLSVCQHLNIYLNSKENPVCGINCKSMPMLIRSLKWVYWPWLLFLDISNKVDSGDLGLLP